MFSITLAVVNHNKHLNILCFYLEITSLTTQYKEIIKKLNIFKQNSGNSWKINNLNFIPEMQSPFGDEEYYQSFFFQQSNIIKHSYIVIQRLIVQSQRTTIHLQTKGMI